MTEHPVPQPPQHHLIAGTEAAHEHHEHAEGGEHHEQYDDARFANSPGRNGPTATVEVEDPRGIGRVHTEYDPKHDGRPDPGEIAWTWVPYEEHDGRGKDRPVLLVAREHGAEQTLLAVKLTSKGWKHEDDRENWVDVGNGHWDSEARESWAVIDKVVRVHHEGIRREACALERHHFEEVVKHLDRRYDWL
jgi:hypothetical protein